MSGAMFSVVCANNQNAKTPIIMPNSNLSFPLDPVAEFDSTDRRMEGVSS